MTSVVVPSSAVDTEAVEEPGKIAELGLVVTGMLLIDCVCVEEALPAAGIGVGVGVDVKVTVETVLYTDVN